MKSAGKSAAAPIDDDRAAALSLVPVSRETEERFALYVDLLRRWQRVKNLVAPSTLHRIWTRHIADSAQIVSLAPSARRWVDMGSGAGFPGLVIAIQMIGLPAARVHLIESDNRKCAFLREVSRATGAPAIIHAARIEDIAPRIEEPVDVVTARALAPLPRLIEMSKVFLDAGALGLFPKGENDESPPEILFGDTVFAVSAVPSRTQDGAHILLVRRVSGQHEAEPLSKW